MSKFSDFFSNIYSIEDRIYKRKKNKKAVNLSGLSVVNKHKGIRKRIVVGATNLKYAIRNIAYIFAALMFFVLVAHDFLPSHYRPKMATDYANKPATETTMEYYKRIGKTDKQIAFDIISDIGNYVLKYTPYAIAAVKNSPLIFVSYSASIALYMVSSYALRVIVQEPRPDDINNKTSFPSGHSVGAFCAATILVLCVRLKWLTFTSILLAAFVAVCRLLANRHFPVDVLAGCFIGCMSATFCYVSFMIFNSKLNIFDVKPLFVKYRKNFDV